MPAFFVPESRPQGSEELYQWIVRYVTAMLDREVEPIRIYSLTYLREGQRFTATVGEIEPRTGQLVMAILRSGSFLICTPYYGVRRGEPLAVTIAEACDVQYFEGPENAREMLRQAVASLDGAAGQPRSRLEAAARALDRVEIGDFPFAVVPDFLSLRHILTWQGGSEATIGRMTASEMEVTAAAIRSLYVETLRVTEQER